MLHPPISLAHHLSTVSDLIDRHPKAIFVLPHCATCYHFSRLLAVIGVMREFKNVYYDLSTVIAGDVVSYLIGEVGVEKILFGTDWPFSFERMSLTYLNNGLVPVHERSLVLNQDEREYDFTYLGYEQMRALKAAVVINLLNASDLEKIFFRNAEEIISQIGTN
jgi:predicted TIM-barrel fold metal-dependent hydrolase